MSEKHVIGINQIVITAEEFLKQLKEFAPFGLIYKDGEWIDLATYDENMDSNDMKSFLINTIVKDFEEGNTEFGGVCVDAKIEDIGDVIMIYNTSNGQDWYELVYKVVRTNDDVKIVMDNVKN
ncbi:hypothetical protein ATE47_01275 [Chryseobacterium sp. IHB B 17019]|uniref:hypothetical protein n=1 Tax=Chryseobacterium sp. IHB B 17019 TaxID=1721091 RepID=UPI0007206640|nr:hypothetical protein [Chryseobacterium sp. IHB B 17019]ALR29243.1 hypothetical protein ATE47_01275 [Chryseobacterium sp. IHB B 17019]